MARKKLNWTEQAICSVLRFLLESDGAASYAAVMSHVENNIDIPDDAKGVNPSGTVKWKVRVEKRAYVFASAGFLRREKGMWSITPLGEKELKGGDALISKKAMIAHTEYRRTLLESTKVVTSVADESDEEEDGDTPVTNRLEEYHASAYESISGYIEKMDPFAFQDLVAALLRGMGYYVREVSPPNTPDGGIDIIAYQKGDLLGAKTPRIRAQVKRQQNKTSRKELENLGGAMVTIDPQSTIAVFISTGGFARGCKEFAKQQPRHTELIDMPRFIELWRDNYDKLSDEDKSLLPLQPIYFLDEERAKRS